MDKIQTTIRLTARMNKELEELIRKEAERRGTTINQTMIHILTEYFKKEKEE